jgi:hypothetical protein
LICFAVTESRTNAGEEAGKDPFSSTGCEVPLTEIFAATKAPFGLGDVVVLLVVVDDDVVDPLTVALPNGSRPLKRLNPLSCPAPAL